jgi:hypothetical protein
MRLNRITVLAWTCLAFTAWPHALHAQEVPKGTADTQGQTELDPHLKPASRRFESPERFFLELHVGPYKVFSGETWNVFSEDQGPSLQAKLDGIIYRMPKIFYVTLGGSIGWTRFAASAIGEEGTPVTEETTLTLLPLAATAQIRIDALPRLLHIPLLIAARVGWGFSHWDTNTGLINDAEGWSLGPIFAGQLALDLDSFEPGGARALDEEWGINHTYVFAELSHFATTGKSLPVGGTNWTAGLGFVF